MKRRRATTYTPALFREITEAFGRDAALRFARAYGGAKLKIPVHEERSAVTRLMGVSFTRWLQARYQPRLVIDVPLGAVSVQSLTGQTVDDMLISGTSSMAEMSRCLKVSGRTIRRRKARLREILGDDAPAHLKLKSRSPASVEVSARAGMPAPTSSDRVASSETTGRAFHVAVHTPERKGAREEVVGLARAQLPNQRRPKCS